VSESTYRRSPLAVWRATPWFLVAAVPGQPPTEVSGSASLVWDELAERSTLADLVDRLVAGTGAPRARITADVEELLAHLVGAGLVEVTS
jgi:hypothetical protein